MSAASRTLLISMAVALGLAAVARDARAESIEEIVVARAATALPGEVAVVAVHAPPSLRGRALEPAQVDVEFPARPRPGRVSVRVRVGGSRPRTVIVAVGLAEVVATPVAARDLAAGTTVSAADVRWERRPRAGRPAAVPIGQVANAAIAAGEVLDEARLTAPPPVARGRELRVVVRRGGVSVTGVGRLEQTAFVGEAARARLPSGALVRGTLVADDRLEVEAP